MSPSLDLLREHPGLVCDYSDEQWKMVCDREARGRLVASLRAGEGMLESPASVLSFFGEARSLTNAAVRFLVDASEVCVEAAGELPDSEIPNPWSVERRIALGEKVDLLLLCMRESLGHLGWISDERVMSLMSYASAGLKREVERAWEVGRRRYFASRDAARCTGAWGSRDHVEEKASGAVGRCDDSPSPRAVARRRGATTESLLRALLATGDGCAKVAAAGSANGVAQLIGKSPSSVKGCPLWKTEVLPLLRSLKTVAQMTRLESDERRQDRRSTWY